MGIIKAAMGSISGALADQWLETIEPAQIDNTVLATYGVKVRKGDSRSSNAKGTVDVISNGSIIHVPENTFMLLVDGGKVISATDEPGYYQVDNSRAPSIFFQSMGETQLAGYGNTGRDGIQRPGGIVNTIKDTWERFKFGGTTPLKQMVVYINKMEIPDIRFGTKNPVPYTDRVLVPGRVVPCKITSFGTYSIKISDPLLFYVEVCSKTNTSNFTTNNMAEQYINEFLMAYTTALASLSNDGIMVSDIPIKTMQLGQYMAETLDNEWLSKRGFYIQSVGIAGISFDEKTDELLTKYANDSILFDPNARAARMTSGMAAGLEAAGSNEGGAMIGFAGMAMGMNAAGAMGVMPNQQNTMQQGYVQSPTPKETWKCNCGNDMDIQAVFCSKCGSKRVVEEIKDAADTWKCECGNDKNKGLFCSNCGSKKSENSSWTCGCGNTTMDKFCSKCGAKKPEDKLETYKCTNCGWIPSDVKNPPAFCPNCGDPFNEQDKQ